MRGAALDEVWPRVEIVSDVRTRAAPALLGGSRLDGERPDLRVPAGAARAAARGSTNNDALAAVQALAARRPSSLVMAAVPARW